MVGGGGATGVVGVFVEIFHGVFCGCEHCVLDMVEEECDSLEGGIEEVGAAETIADQVSNSAGVEVNTDRWLFWVLLMFLCVV